MANLYEIDQGILSCIDAETGEIIDFERLAQLQMERDQKIENVALWYKNLLSDADQYRKEKEAFAKREEASKNKAEGLKKWLDTALQGHNYQSVKATISYRKSEQVVIENPSLLPDHLLRTPMPEPNKIAIKAAIKAGQTVNGAYLKTQRNIQIK